MRERYQGSERRRLAVRENRCHAFEVLNLYQEAGYQGWPSLRFEDNGEILRFLKRENLPGYFPYTAGVFPFRREGEDPARMFAGEGDPARTNRRFKKLSEHSEAKRLSTAFDSVTLYGFDPATRPDIYGKIGNSGVSIATLDEYEESAIWWV